MRARPRPGGWLLNGKRYATEAAYVEALRRWNERRARLMAAFEAEHDPSAHVHQGDGLPEEQDG